MKNQQEYARWANEQQRRLLSKPIPQEEAEKDIWNLKDLMYSIKPGSLHWRLGMVSTLRRCIAKMEKEIVHENNG
ncbi:hypothetical protein AGMMS49944_03910 [Spirochaetia bacterium]|nr:hypothetical protein AGMMS49944_03910 [Spirochaetia bacterium]